MLFALLPSLLLLQSSPTVEDLSPSANAEMGSMQDSAALELRKRLMYLRVDGPSANLMGAALYSNGKHLEIGYFGGGAEEHFKDVPEAAEAARGFVSDLRWGFGLTIGGAAMLGAGLAYLLTARLSFPNARDTIIAASILAAGSVPYFIGAFLLRRASVRFLAAINLHNAGILNRHLPEDEKLSPELFLSLGPGGLSVAGTF